MCVCLLRGEMCFHCVGKCVGAPTTHRCKHTLKQAQTRRHADANTFIQSRHTCQTHLWAHTDTHRHTRTHNLKPPALSRFVFQCSFLSFYQSCFLPTDLPSPLSLHISFSHFPFLLFHLTNTDTHKHNNTTHSYPRVSLSLSSSNLNFIWN